MKICALDVAAGHFRGRGDEAFESAVGVQFAANVQSSSGVVAAPMPAAPTSDSACICRFAVAWFSAARQGFAETPVPKALTITRDDDTAVLREAARRSNDADAKERMLALALVLEEYKRGEAGKLRGMDRRTLRGWVPPHGIPFVEEPGASPRLPRATGHRSFPNAAGMRRPSRA